MAKISSGRMLRKTQNETSGGDAYDDLEIGPVPDEEQWVIDWASGRDETTDITKTTFGIKSGGHIYWFYETTVAAAAELASVAAGVSLVAGESLIVRLTGCTSDDVLKAKVIGVYYELREVE